MSVAGTRIEPVAGAKLVPLSVPFESPWEWLAAGWRDLTRIPAVSLGYGAVFAISALLIMVGLTSTQQQSLFFALASGFPIIGPLAAVGLYEASRRLAAGEPVSFGAVFAASIGKRGHLAFFGAILLFAMMVWVYAAFMLLALFLGTTGVPPPSAFMQTLLFTPSGLGLLIAGTVVGGLISTLIFSISVVAVPLILDRDIDAATAIAASLAAVRANPKPMALWAALIALLIAAGLVTLLAGFVVTFPLIGHATWHAAQTIYPAARTPAVEGRA